MIMLTRSSERNFNALRWTNLIEQMRFKNRTKKTKKKGFLIRCAILVKIFGSVQRRIKL